MSASLKGSKMTARFRGVCHGCGAAFEAGAAIVYYREAAPGRRTMHRDCARIAALPYKIQACGWLSLARGGADETYYLDLARKLEDELATLTAARDARLAAAAAAA